MLIRGKEAERFLVELANLHDGGVNRLKAQFTDMLPRPPVAGVAIVRGTTDPSGITQSELVRVLTLDEIHRDFFLSLRNRLQLVWRESDPRRKRYGIFLIWYWALSPMDIRVSEMPDRLSLPPLSPLEIALDYLLTNSDRARFCLNPECVVPYFFAKRRSQKYCSDECAKPAKREAKLRWWNKEGKKLRADRAKASRREVARRTKKKGQRKEDD
jgi:hypothetical protein